MFSDTYTQSTYTETKRENRWLPANKCTHNKYLGICQNVLLKIVEIANTNEKLSICSEKNTAEC